MSSLDFEEFLLAIGIAESAVTELRAFFLRREKVPPAVHTNKRVSAIPVEVKSSRGRTLSLDKLYSHFISMPR